VLAAGLILLAVAAGLALALWIWGERGRYMPSTLTYFRESGFSLKSLHGYVYGRWTGRYVKVLFSQMPGVSGEAVSAAGMKLAESYHSKVLTLDHARQVVLLEKDIPLTDLEQIVPFPVARNIVLKGPPDIVAFECPCRHARPSHCTPTQVCMIVGKPMTDFVLEHQPAKARRLTRQEALDLLEAEHARGHVHSAWFKDAMMDRFYAICNCCTCCCGGIAGMRRGYPMMAGSGYAAEIENSLCGDCGDCSERCPFGALKSNGGAVVVDWAKCMGCGVCETACQAGAIRLVRDERKGVPMDVRALL
jgi:Pyruvate/2-oxoacid:ferredoxin oxidoreductase delta subunit